MFESAFERREAFGSGFGSRFQAKRIGEQTSGRANLFNEGASLGMLGEQGLNARGFGGVVEFAEGEGGESRVVGVEGHDERILPRNGERQASGIGLPAVERRSAARRRARRVFKPTWINTPTLDTL